MKLLDPLVAHVFTASLFGRRMVRDVLNEVIDGGPAQGQTPGELFAQMQGIASDPVRLPLFDAFMLGMPGKSKKSLNLLVAGKLLDSITGGSCLNSEYARLLQESCTERLESAKRDLLKILNEFDMATMISVHQLFKPTTSIEEHILLLKAAIDALPKSSFPQVHEAERAVKYSIGSVLPDFRRVDIRELRTLVAKTSPFAGTRKHLNIMDLLQQAIDAPTPEKKLGFVRSAFVAIQTSEFSPEVKRYADFVTYEALKETIRSLNTKIADIFLRDLNMILWSKSMVASTTLLRAMLTGRYPHVIWIPEYMVAALRELKAAIPMRETAAIRSLNAIADFYSLSLY